MYGFQTSCHTICDRYCYFVWGKNNIIGKSKLKLLGKDKCKTLAVIPLMTLVGIYHRQHILHMSKIMIHFYSTDENINQFAIGYMINPSLNCNKLFRQQVEKLLSVLFH